MVNAMIARLVNTWRRAAWRLLASPSEVRGLGHGRYAFYGSGQGCGCGHRHPPDVTCWDCFDRELARAYRRLDSLSRSYHIDHPGDNCQQGSSQGNNRPGQTGTRPTERGTTDGE